MPKNSAFRALHAPFFVNCPSCGAIGPSLLCRIVPSQGKHMARSFRIPSRALCAAVAVAAGSGFPAGPAAAAGGPFLSHQALYELSLVKSRGTNAINGARGRILYNFTGNACEGYTSEFRQVSELDSGEGKLTFSDLRSTSWEDAAGKSYRFKIDARMNDSDSCAGRRHRRAGRRSHHGEAEGAGREDLRARWQRRVSHRADPAHHCRRARGQDACSSSPSMTAPTMAKKSTTRSR